MRRPPILLCCSLCSCLQTRAFQVVAVVVVVVLHVCLRMVALLMGTLGASRERLGDVLTD